MESLAECYQKLATSDWSYYKYPPFEGEILKVFENDNALSFIEKYLSEGNKLTLVKDVTLKEIAPKRFYHTVSCFLLGVHLHKLSLEKQVPFDDDVIKNPWLYTWFLTCLYHDIGYYFEDQSQKHLKKGIKNLIPKLKEYDPVKDLQYYKLGSHYFQYRKKFAQKIDHGVVGGLRLYAILKDLINKNMNKAKQAERELLYSEELFPLQNKAADAIIRHNMWQATANSQEAYEMYHLTDLLSPGQKISKEEEFTFLLAICDTIEPLKRFDCLPPILVLSNIQLETNENKITIQIPNWLFVDNYIDPIRSLCDWVELSVTASGNSFNIKF